MSIFLMSRKILKMTGKYKNNQEKVTNCPTAISLVRAIALAAYFRSDLSIGALTLTYCRPLLLVSH